MAIKAELGWNQKGLSSNNVQNPSYNPEELNIQRNNSPQAKDKPNQPEDTYPHSVELSAADLISPDEHAEYLGIYTCVENSDEGDAAKTTANRAFLHTNGRCALWRHIEDPEHSAWVFGLAAAISAKTPAATTHDPDDLFDLMTPDPIFAIRSVQRRPAAAAWPPHRVVAWEEYSASARRYTPNPAIAVASTLAPLRPIRSARAEAGSESDAEGRRGSLHVTFSDGEGGEALSLSLSLYFSVPLPLPLAPSR